MSVNQHNDPIALARAVGLIEPDAPRRWWKVPRSVEINTEVVLLGGYVLLSLGVYIGLIVHP